MFGGRRNFVRWRPSPVATARQSFLQGLRARRASLLTTARTATRRPLGLPAFRGFRGLGSRRATEKKVLDIAAGGGIVVNSTGSFSLLNGCVQGSDYTNRIGRKMLNKSIYIRGFLQSQQSAGVSSALAAAQLVRCIIFIDMQPNGAAPATTDLLNTASSVSHLNLNNRDRFKVLVDRTYNIGASAYQTTATQAFATLGEQTYVVSIYKKISLETIFNSGNAGTIADMNSGAIYMFWINNSAVGGDESIASVTSRIRFLDP